jgi:hypothetical protein
MLNQQALSVEQLVERDVDLQVLLRQRHVLIHLERVVEVGDVAQRVEELVHARLVVVDEGLERHHVRFLGVRRLVGEVLEELGDLRSGENERMKGKKEEEGERTRVRVRRGCLALAGRLSMSMYACGVTMAGLMKRRKKKPPIKEQMA